LTPEQFAALAKRRQADMEMQNDRMAALIATVINMAGKVSKNHVKPSEIFPKGKAADDDPEAAALRASGKSHIKVPIDEYLEMKKRG